ncbi:unnamed protein product [Lymnaea stagnalis]|uniref:Otopetrin-2 n=1 Tax=Lymnaea stagnalis TaxID=6523 RepID=A0AAV2HVJ1_LYMST
MSHSRHNSGGSVVSFRLGGKRITVPGVDKEPTPESPTETTTSLSNKSVTGARSNDDNKSLGVHNPVGQGPPKPTGPIRKDSNSSLSHGRDPKRGAPSTGLTTADHTHANGPAAAAAATSGAHANGATGNDTKTDTTSARSSSHDDIGSDIINLLRHGHKKDVDHKHDGHHDPHSEKAALDKRHGQPAVLKESLFMILSGLYGVVIVILGAVIPITEIFVKNNEEKAFEAFYLYLYVVSIIFLVYVYAYLLRRNRLKTEFLTRTLSRSMSWTRNWAKSWAKADEATKGKLRKRMISLDVSNHHTGTFYLRLGVLGFGIGSMIHSGLNFGTFFAVTDENCSDPLDAVKPLFHLVFTFFQLYFIFMNSKMCIHRYKKLARFGLMHMCATNICVWFRSIVVETLHVIHMHQHASHHGHDKPHDASGGHTSHDSHSPQDGHTSQDSHHGDGHGNLTYQILNATVNVGRKLHAAASSSSSSSATNGSKSSTISDSCQGSGMMSQAVEAAGPYLYPCTIEYSLMCAGILYIMWKNVGNKPRRPRQSELDDDDDDQRVHRMSVDCTGSSRGLFLGILMMVGTIISIIAFYMLVNTEELHSSAIILTHLSETFIYAVTLFAIIMAAIKMKSLTFHNEHEADLEDILVLISYTGLLVFIIFSLVASILHEADTRSALTILSNITMLIQSTAQTIFMLAGDRMTASTELHERKKPGREFITFLLISNFAMWAVNTFETQTPQHNPIQVEFYGPEAWAIFTHVSVPLGIYYRFHSTVCFSNIWKNAWKVRKHDHH